MGQGLKRPVVTPYTGVWLQALINALAATIVTPYTGVWIEMNMY
ncbi:hypothetical protein ACE3NQ_12870 [Paenibacillus terreus]|uniref:Uncharacterized protein n=1 Tax=Paenibacillus terreus TaxID=1387834 RepID=A0ABV5B8H7_9BACL